MRAPSSAGWPMVGRGDLVGLAAVVGVGVAATVGATTVAEGAAVAAGVAAGGDSVALDAHPPRSPRTATPTSSRSLYPRPSIAITLVGTRTPRVGLASGSARSRRPWFGPRVRAPRQHDTVRAGRARGERRTAPGGGASATDPSCATGQTKNARRATTPGRPVRVPSREAGSPGIATSALAESHKSGWSPEQAASILGLSPTVAAATLEAR